MAGKVLVASLKHPGKAVRVESRIAAHLVARGTHAYVTQAVETEDEAVTPRARKRTYRRRDMKAEED